MGISFKDTILHMFVKDKVEQKPKEQLSDEELKKMSDWLLQLHDDCEKELERRRS